MSFDTSNGPTSSKPALRAAHLLDTPSPPRYGEARRLSVPAPPDRNGGSDGGKMRTALAQRDFLFLQGMPGVFLRAWPRPFWRKGAAARASISIWAMSLIGGCRGAMPFAAL